VKVENRGNGPIKTRKRPFSLEFGAGIMMYRGDELSGIVLIVAIVKVKVKLVKVNIIINLFRKP
jgi:hypothetical protein